MSKSACFIFTLLAIFNPGTYVTAKHSRGWGVPHCNMTACIVKEDCLAAFKQLSFDQSDIYTAHGTTADGDLHFDKQQYGTCSIEVAARVDGCQARRAHLLTGLEDQTGSGLEGLLNKCIANKQAGLIPLLKDPQFPDPETETRLSCHWSIHVSQNTMDSCEH